MLEVLKGFFKKIGKKEEALPNSKDAAKERLHLVLMQDRANVSADFLELMKQEIIDVIKKYIEVDEKDIDVRLTHQINEDGTNGAPALYANIPILGIKSEKKIETHQKKQEKVDKEIVSKISEKTRKQCNIEAKEENEKENNKILEIKQENDNLSENNEVKSEEQKVQITEESFEENKTELKEDNDTLKSLDEKKSENMKKNGNKKKNKSNNKIGSSDISLKNVYKTKK